MTYFCWYTLLAVTVKFLSKEAFFYRVPGGESLHINLYMKSPCAKGHFASNVHRF